MARCWLCHKWEEWDWRDKPATGLVRKCKRCGVVQFRQCPHDWGEWSVSEGGLFQRKKCLRCSFEKEVLR